MKFFVKVVAFLKGKYATLSLSNLFAIHIFLCGLGIFDIYASVITLLEKQYQLSVKKPLDQIRFFEWIQPYIFPMHKYTIFAYIFSVALLVGLFIFAYFILRDAKKKLTSVSAQVFPWVYILDILFISQMLFFKIEGKGFSIVLIVLWMIILFIPYYRISTLAKFFFAAVYIELLFLLIPLATGKFYILNEYFDIPSQTYIHRNEGAPPRMVDNLKYINKERLWGNHLRYDMRVDNGYDPQCLPGNFIDVKRNERLEYLVKKNKYQFYFHYPSDKLCFIGEMSYESYNRIKSMLPKNKWKELDDAYERNKRYYVEFYEQSPNVEHIDFLNKNAFELTQTIHDMELTFYHHFQFLNPINELTLERPINEIISLYGNNFLVLKAILGIFGGVTYEAFLHLMFFSYLFYYIFFTAILIYIFRDIRYVAAVLLFAVGSINGLGFLTLFTGLGYTPIRHFIDIFVFFLCYKYLLTERPNWLITAMVVAGVGLFFDRFIGSFMFIALLGILFIRMLFSHTVNKRFETLALLAGSALYLLIFSVAGNITAQSSFLQSFSVGVQGSPVSMRQMMFILMSFIAAYAVLILAFITGFRNVYYFILLLVFYIQVYFLYWLTIPNYGHINVIYPYIAFAVMAGLKFIFEPMLARKFSLTFLGLIALILGAGMLYFTTTSLKFWRSYNEYNEVAQNHVIYEWKFSNMHVRSSMDPEYFSKASTLIKKYSFDRKGIYIISKYDTLLMFLSSKYSLMPHFELSPYLSNYEAFDMAVEQIEKIKPDIIFVDTDMKRNPLTVKLVPYRASTLPPGYSALMDRKINRLTVLKDFFEKIEHHYKKVDQNELLAVYRRI